MAKIINFLNETGLSDESLDFLEQSKMNEYDVIEYSRRLNVIMSSDYFMNQIVNSTHELSCFERIKLPDVEFNSTLEKSLSQINNLRQSTRKYKREEELTLANLASLLKLSYSITKTVNGFPPSRNIASGGGLYPIDLYVVNRKINGLKEGIHYYNIHNTTLDLVTEFNSTADLESKINRAFFSNQKKDMDYVDAAAYIVLGGSLNRVCFKYLDRGLRFALIDTGAILHSLYLGSAALGIGCCAVGSYADDLVSELIGYNSNTQTVLGVILIGKA